MLHENITRRVIRAFYDVYDELGVGFLESVYEAAMEIALADAGVKVMRQVDLPVRFRQRLAGRFRADLLVEDAVLVELKAARELAPIHEAQLLNYLRASRVEVGLLLNFGPAPAFRRLAFANERKGVPVGPRRGPPRSSAAHDHVEPVPAVIRPDQLVSDRSPSLPPPG